MADTRISELTELTGASVASTDEFVVVDKSDTTMAASGTDKRVVASGLPSIPALANAFDAAGAATSAVTTHAGATDPHGDRAYAAALVDDLSGVTDAATARANIGAAPLAPSFLTLGTNSELTNERVLTAGTNITLTDGGAGSTLTIAATGGGSALYTSTTNPGIPGVVATSAGTGALGYNNLDLAMIVTTAASTLAELWCEVTAGHTAGAKLRMGLYSVSSNSSGTLLIDGGELDASTTGVKKATSLGYSLPAGRYWLGLLHNVNPTLTFRYVNGRLVGSPLGSSLGSNAFVTYVQKTFTTYGALPASFTGATVSTGSGTTIYQVFPVLT